MSYRFYLYKINNALAENFYVICMNKYLKTKFLYKWQLNDLKKQIDKIDVEEIKNDLNNKLIAQVSAACFNINIFRYTAHKFSYIEVNVEDEYVQNIIGILIRFALQRDLVLYDCVLDKTYTLPDCYNKEVCKMRSEAQRLQTILHESNLQILYFEKIEETHSHWNNVISYIISVKIPNDKNFNECIKQFDSIVKKNFQKYQIIWRNKFLSIIALSDGNTFDKQGESTSYPFKIQVCLEGTNDNEYWDGYIDNDKILIEKKIRFNSHFMFNWLKTHQDNNEKDNVMDRMYFYEMIDLYPNPIVRLSKSIKISQAKILKKLGIKYGKNLCGDIFNFKKINDEIRYSEFSIHEDIVSFILPIIYEVYPFIYDRYYDSTYLHSEIFDKIKIKLLDFRNTLINEKLSDKLNKYYGEFNLYTLLPDITDTASYDEQENLYRNNPKQFLYQHRFAIVHLIDIFIKWLDLQGSNYIIEISGP